MAKSTLGYFDEILEIPRPSGEETLMRNHLIERGNEFGFEHKVDSYGNLVIYVPATPDQEDSETMILQAHMDMVCVKTEESTHDFAKDAVRKVLKGDWMYADNTTLGADNGMGIAMMQAATHLSSHPRMELLFTVDEERGLVGASNLDPSILTGKNVINLDSEELGEICISSAGGARVNVSQAMETEAITYDQHTITIKGMRAGHSGTEIHENRGNAIRLLLTLVKETKEELGIDDVQVTDINGGQAFNGIPGACSITLGTENNELFMETLRKKYDLLIKNYDAPDAQLVIDKASTPLENHLLGFDDISERLLSHADGVIHMSENIEGLVETSINLGMISRNDDTLSFCFLPRSSMPEKLDSEIAKLQEKFSTGEIEILNKYYGWEQDPNSELVQTMKKVYTEVAGTEAKIVYIHAGLECGAVAGKLGEESQAVSIGPTIKSPHSPKERVNIPSVKVVAKILFEFLSTKGTEVFTLDTELLQEYPEMNVLSGLTKKDAPQETWNVSQIYVNGRTIDVYIQNVLENKHTGDIEYLLDMVEKGLQKLSRADNAEYTNFITTESQKLEGRKKRAQEAIGDKKRIDGLYQ